MHANLGRLETSGKSKTGLAATKHFLRMAIMVGGRWASWHSWKKGRGDSLHGVEHHGGVAEAMAADL